jgi:hypothetical protein
MAAARYTLKQWIRQSILRLHNNLRQLADTLPRQYNGWPKAVAQIPEEYSIGILTYQDNILQCVPYKHKLCVLLRPAHVVWLLSLNHFVHKTSPFVRGWIGSRLCFTYSRSSCMMTKLMHKFLNLFYLSIYFCLTCFGLSFRPSSEAGVQRRNLGMVSAPARWHHTQETWTTAEVVRLPLKMG